MSELIEKAVQPVVNLIPVSPKFKKNLRQVLNAVKTANQLVGTFKPDLPGRAILTACTNAWDDKLN